VILNIKFVLSTLNRFWLNFKVQTQLILILTIVISLSISVLSSVTINTIQEKSKVTELRYTRDIGMLLGTNLISLINENRYYDIFPFCERFYKNSPSLKYLVINTDEGNLTYSIPFSLNEVNQYSDVFITKKNLPDHEYNISPETTFILKLYSNTKQVGTLILDFNINSIFLQNSKVIENIILAFFFLLWLTSIIGTVLNASTITRPLKELVKGINNITQGDFNQTVTLPLGGELGELIVSFNEMGRKLQKYDENNIKTVVEEKTKLESLIATIADGALLLNTNLDIVLVNDAAIKIFNWPKNTTLIGTPIWEHLPIRIQKKLFVALREMVFTSSSTSFYSEIEFRKKGYKWGKKFICIVLKAVYDHKGSKTRPIGITLTIQDKTKEFELDQTRSLFMSNISHELRTPLFNISSFIETTQEYNYTLSTKQKEKFLGVILEETKRLTNLVNNILNLSRLDSSISYLDKQIQINIILEKVIESYKLIAFDKSIVIRSSYSPNIPSLTCNSGLLMQVLVNLIGNAFKFNYKHGEIHIRVYELNEDNKRIIRLEIVDTGIGLPVLERELIFQRFYRVENEIHTITGTGLGLSIVKTILSKRNTRLHVNSKLKVGSIFWFDLHV
jgi:two-component system, OmpR family, sensor histidine kinase NblS